MPLAQDVELTHVFHDERAVDRPKAVHAFRIVVDHEEAGAGGKQPMKSQVGRPAISPIVVLN